jgi:hypothetical protein
MRVVVEIGWVGIGGGGLCVGKVGYGGCAFGRVRGRAGLVCMDG